jgi:hypothetical protein
MRNSIQRSWVKAGAICGILSIIAYPVLLLVPFPLQITLVVGCLFGILLLVGSIGLYHFISLNRKTVSAQLGALFNVIGCSVVTMMLTIQLALHPMSKNPGFEISKEMKSYIFQIPNIIQLGLDVVWDIFAGVGTILLALNMFRHPRFGKIFSITGILAAIALLVLNIYTFPYPPAESGSFDMGPLVALWYLAVMIQTARSLGWIDGLQEA